MVRRSARNRNRRWMFLATAGLVIVSACSEDDPGPAQPNQPNPTPPTLVGTWDRVNSSSATLDGMRVQVDAAETQGVITSTPVTIFMFQVGDVKWRSIVKGTGNAYTFEDLAREANTGDTSYIAGDMTLNAAGDSLRMDFTSTGTFQEWLRVP